MAVPKPDFTKQFGSAKTDLKPISDSNYLQGWDFVGSTPPDKNDFTYLQHLADQRSIWLNDNTVKTSQIGNGSGQIPSMANFASLLTAGADGYVKLPSGFILQFGSVSVPANSQQGVTVSLPLQYPTFHISSAIMSIDELTANYYFGQVFARQQGSFTCAILGAAPGAAPAVSTISLTPRWFSIGF